MGSDLNAADKMPMYEILGFRGRVSGLKSAIFVLQLWELAFCHWRFVPRSAETYTSVARVLNYGQL